MFCLSAVVVFAKGLGRVVSPFFPSSAHLYKSGLKGSALDFRRSVIENLVQDHLYNG